MGWEGGEVKLSPAAPSMTRVWLLDAGACALNMLAAEAANAPIDPLRFLVVPACSSALSTSSSFMRAYPEESPALAALGFSRERSIAVSPAWMRAAPVTTSEPLISNLACIWFSRDVTRTKKEMKMAVTTEAAAPILIHAIRTAAHTRQRRDAPAVAKKW